MIYGFIENVRGFLISPQETFRKSRETSLTDSFVYFLILTVINAVLTSILFAAGIGLAGIYGDLPVQGLAVPFLILAGGIIGGIIIAVIGGVWIHLWVWLLGGRKGIHQTFKAVFYGDTPYLLLSWIPLIGIIGWIWSFVLYVTGIRELHDLSISRALGAVLIALLIPVIIIMLVAAYFIISPVTSIPVSPV